MTRSKSFPSIISFSPRTTFRRHTTPTELGKLAQQTQAKKLVATHLWPYTSLQAAVDRWDSPYGPCQDVEILFAEYISAIKKHYLGPLIIAEDGMVIEIGKAK